MENPQIVASFTREYPNKNMSLITRFISHHPFQCDPLFEYLTPDIKETVVKKCQDYEVCVFKKNKIPPVSHMLFRVDFLKKSGVWNQRRDYDLDTIIKLIKSGYDRFAYVESAGDSHYHAKTLRGLVQKRLRNLDNHFFAQQNSLEYSWIDVTQRRQIFKLLLWVLYANMIIPATIRGIVKSLKYKDMVLLAEPVVALVTTDAILFKFITDKRGRLLIKKYLSTLC